MSDKLPRLSDAELSVVTGNYGKTSLDSQTLCDTPVPVAASTVARADRNKVRHLGNEPGDCGSIIEENSTTMSIPPEQDALRFSLGDGNETGTLDDASRKSSITGGRGSMEMSSSIIDIENMSGLSGSMIRFSGIMDDSIQKLTSTSRLSTASTVASTSSSSTVKEAPFRGQGVQAATPALTPPVGQSKKLDIAPGGMLFGAQAGGEHDVSVHEVKLDADDLKQFEADCSDFDADTTLTDDTLDTPDEDVGPPAGIMKHYTQAFGTDAALGHASASYDVVELPSAANNPFNKGEAHLNRYFVEQKQMSMQMDFDTGTSDLFSRPNDPHGLPLDLLMGDGVNEDDEGYDEVDVPPGPPASGSAANENSLFWENQRLAGRPMYFDVTQDEHTNGEGQEDVTTQTGAPKLITGDDGQLDSIYFRQTRPEHNAGDGQENGDAVGRSSSIFGDMSKLSSPSPRKPHRQEGLYSEMGSDIDTDDELEAVRQSNRMYTTQEGASGYSRADGEDAEDIVQLERESGEGDVTSSPVPGDGGGGGDGSSDVEEDVQPRGAAGATTSEILRGLGFLHNGLLTPSSQDEVPDNEDRVQPMGDDLLSDHDYAGNLAQHVHFNNPDLFRDRTLSGASVDAEDDQNNGTAQSVDVDDQGLASRFFMTSDPMSRTAGSQVPGYDSSIFQHDSVFPEVESTQSGPQMLLGVEDNQSLRPSHGSSEPSSTDRTSVQTVVSMASMSPGHSGQGTGQYSGTVWFNEDGEGVTDLAYTNVFEDIVAQGNPFDGQQNPFDCSEAFDNPDLDFNDLQKEFDDESQFIRGEDALAKLEEDQKKFEEENVFTQDDAMEPASITPPVEDSWSYKTDMTVMRPSWVSPSECDAPYMRISIGTFMRGRTEALGSLDGNSREPRPNFGNSIRTPPERQPKPLLPELSPSNRDSHQALDDIRGSGVGSDIEGGDNTTGGDDSPACMQTPTHLGKDTAQNSVLPPPEEEEVFTSPESVNDAPLTTADLSEDKSAKKAPAFDLSEITGLIVSASSSTSNRDLANMILKMSMGQADEGNAGNTERKPVERLQVELPKEVQPEPRRDELDGKADTQELKPSSTSVAAKPEKPSSLSRESDRKGPDGQVDQTVPAPTVAPKLVSDKPSMGQQTRSSTGVAESKARVSGAKIKTTDKRRDSDSTGGRKSSTSRLKSGTERSQSPGNAADIRSVTPPVTGAASKSYHNKSQTTVTKPQTTKVTPQSRTGSAKPQTVSKKPQRVSSQTDPAPARTVTATTNTQPQNAKASTGSQNLQRRSSKPEMQKQAPLPKRQEPTPKLQPTQGVPAVKRQLPSVTSKNRNSTSLSGPPVQQKVGSKPQGVLASKNAAVSSSISKTSKPPCNKSQQSKLKARSSGNEISPRSHFVTTHPVNGTSQPHLVSLTGHGHTTPPPEVTTQTSTGSPQTMHTPPRLASPQKPGVSTDGRPSVNGNEIYGESVKPVRQLQGHVTPKDKTSSAQLIEKRTSSTPHHPMESIKFAQSQASLSCIVPHFDDNVADTTLWTEAGSPGKSQENYYFQRRNIRGRHSGLSDLRKSDDGLEETPKSSGTMQLTQYQANMDTMQKSDLMVQSIAKQNVPTEVTSASQDKPTLLTRKSLQKTPFVAQYLDTRPPLGAKPPLTRTDEKPRDKTPDAGHLLNGYPVAIGHHQLATVPQKQGLYAQSTPYVTTATMAVPSEITPTGPPQEQVVPSSGEMSNPPETSQGTPPYRDGRSQNLPVMTGPLIDVPDELMFRDPSCVGLSLTGLLPVRNLTSSWLKVVLKLVSLNVNGTNIMLSSGSVPFFFKDKLALEPQSVEDVQVIFAPRHPGVYIAKIQILVSPVLSNHGQRLEHEPITILYRAEAENPHVQVLVPSDSVADFGAISWGSEKGLPVSLANRGRATIPLRLAITTSHSSGNYFSFKEHSSGDVSIISQTSRPQTPSLAPSITNMLLPGTVNDTEEFCETVVYFRPPYREKQGVMSPPEVFKAQLSITVDVPSGSMDVASVSLTGVAGYNKLHIPYSLEQIKLTVKGSESSSYRLQMRNAGNIPLQLLLYVTEHRDLFHLPLNEVTIPPGGDSEAVILFEPPRKGQEPAVYNSHMQVQIEPSGPVYEIPLIGEIAPPPPAPPPPTNLLLSDKDVLLWGGVPIGRALQQSVTLKLDSKEPLRLRMMIQGSTEDFQLQSLFGEHQKLSDSKEVVMKPGEGLPVHVLYAPSKAAPARAKLSLRLVDKGVKYLVHLRGYGGTSNLLLEDVKESHKASYWTNVPVTAGNTIMKEVTIRNKGLWAAYVKQLCFTDLSCKDRTTKMVVPLSEFVIPAGQSKTVIVVLKPELKDEAMCEKKPSIIGTVVFYYGDEICRRMCRRAIKKYGLSVPPLPAENPLSSVNFNVPYPDEHLCTEDFPWEESPVDLELFYSTINKMTLTFVGEQPLPKSFPDEMSTPSAPAHRNVQPTNNKIQAATQRMGVKVMPALSNGDSYNEPDRPVVPPGVHKETYPPVLTAHDLAALARPCVNQTCITTSSDHHNLMEKQEASPPTRDGPVDNKKTHFSVDSNRETAAESNQWEINPKQIILTAARKAEDILVKKVQIANYSERPMKFELMWPAHLIKVTPAQGSVDARSSVMLCVSPTADLLQQDVLLPWQGSIWIICDSQQKVLPVQIHKDVVMDDTIVGTWGKKASHLLPQPATPLCAVRSPYTKNKANDTLAVTKQVLEFPDTPSGKNSVIPLELSNLSREPVKWDILSYAPAYTVPLQNGFATGQVCRTTYTVFRFAETEGTLEPNETKQVPVEFLPQSAGEYKQYWEITTQSHKPPRTITPPHVIKLELSGKSHPDLPKPAPQQPVLPDSPQSLPPLLGIKAITKEKVTTETSKGKADLVTVSVDHLDFPISKPGENQVCKLKLRNKDTEAHKINIITLKPPFYSKVTNFLIQGQHFVRLPIQYNPARPGKHMTLMVMKTNHGKTLSVHLTGQCE